mmetsp:Transcript_122089/g.279646  ORF Transcript_122089/g.279646 Transcript_122089/m.279646 type:complete len:185 (+) Transcript_122089:43-597(+)
MDDPDPRAIVPKVHSDLSSLRRAIALSRLGPGETFLDLGCGNGTSVIEACKVDPTIRGIGVEVRAGALRDAHRLAAAAGVSSQVTFLDIDFRSLTPDSPELAGVSVVYTYLLENILNDVLAALLEGLVQRGVRWVSFYHHANWADEHIAQPDLFGMLRLHALGGEEPWMRPAVQRGRDFFESLD